MKRRRYVGTLPGLILIIGLGVASRLYADGSNEKTLNAEGSKIQVRYLGVKADVLSVKPYIKAKEGKKKGNLWLDVVVKNTGSDTQAYNIFGQAQTMSGGWVGGSIKAPKKGELEPGKETAISVNTRYQAESVPKEIRVEVLPPK